MPHAPVDYLPGGSDQPFIDPVYRSKKNDTAVPTECTEPEIT
jgi:hypothetical protein